MSAAARLMEKITPILQRIEAFELEKEGEVDGEGRLDVVAMLMMALKNEIEASEIAAQWMAETDNSGLKLALARQVGDEARHYRLIQDRLKDLGRDTTDHDPLAQGHSPLFEYLMTLEGDAARIAAGPFAREALAVAKNRQFIRALKASGDVLTAALYEKQVNPDETYHHELGRTWVDRLVVSDEDFAAAEKAVEGVLAVAEEVQELLHTKKGLHHTPGC